MPQIIEHRRNTLAQLAKVKPFHGVEIDIRSHVCRPSKLHIAHDPWKMGADFEAWLRQFISQKVKGTLILNMKEDGLEDVVTASLNAHGISNYFFLDAAPATLVRRCQAGLGAKMAARLSAFELQEGLRAYSLLDAPFRPAWLWVDCFGGTPIEHEMISPLCAFYKICLVSPELHGFSLANIDDFTALYKLADAVCTKHPNQWEL